MTSGLDVELSDLIAHTSISMIFGVVDDDNCVVKIVNRSDILANEIRILKRLQAYSGEGIIELVCSSKIAMLLRPRAVTSFNKSQKPTSTLVDIVDKLHICHNMGIVHGDVRLSNILVCKDDGLILADFGCSLMVGEVGCINTYQKWPLTLCYKLIVIWFYYCITGMEWL